jgi:hypothetical protein
MLILLQGIISVAAAIAGDAIALSLSCRCSFTCHMSRQSTTGSRTHGAGVASSGHMQYIREKRPQADLHVGGARVLVMLAPRRIRDDNDTALSTPDATK